MGRLTINPATGMLEFAGSGGSGGSGITIGTTTITGGVSGRVLYDAAGVVGEMTTTGSGTVLVLQTSPSLITPLLGTPTSGTLTNCTGLPLGGLTGLGTGVATALSVNIGSAGAFVVFNGALGTPSSGTLTSCTGLPIAGLTGLGTGVATALAVNVGSAGAFVTFNGALGTPSSGTLTNATGLPVASGISGLGTGVATFLATPSSANLLAALTTSTGTGLNVFAIAPALTGPVTLAEAVGSSGLTITGATQTSSFPALSITQTNSNTSGTLVALLHAPTFSSASTSTMVGVAARIAPVINYSAGTPGAGSYEALKIAVTETALPTGTNFLIRASTGSAGTTDVFTVDRAGTIKSLSSANDFFRMTSGGLVLNTNAVGVLMDVSESLVSSGAAIRVGALGSLSWQSTNRVDSGSADLILNRAAAAVLQLGFNVNGAAVSQTVQAANGITGTDRTGGNLTAASGKGTGAGAVSSIIFQTPTVLASGTTAQSLATRLTLSSAGAVFTGSLTTLGGATFHTTSSALTDGAGVGLGTLATAPAAGNPTKWIGINDNGTTRYIPAW